ncbi:MAG TPA: YqgE/AlgH family protein [Jiangellales bacterium]|nr:YqgE/AlgH family protein [Jiangellales bacterium]
MSSLAGRLLVATPALTEPNFARSVVLLLEHGDEGALGVIVNRPTEIPVSEVLPEWQPVVSRPGVLFQGGPVSLDGALGLVAPAGAGLPPGARAVPGGLALVDLDTPTEEVLPQISGARIFAGYAGWGAEQLEGEIEEGAWYVVDALPVDAFRADAADLWRLVLRRQRGPLALLSTYPPDPTLN